MNTNNMSIRFEKTIKSLLLCGLFALMPIGAQAQCTFRNTAFKGGEFLSYNL